jgi:two-component system sensor histidine kinase MprB
VLQNLLSNAEKYSPSNAPITVTVGREDGYLRVAVLDRGPGLGEAEASQIFEPFYRADSARGKPGLGLGLTVCRRLITLQEGEISAAPRPGGGTEIAFRLPGAASSELHEDEPQPQQMRQGA